MTKQDRQISKIVAEERSRLRNFIRRRVPDPSDAEDIVQEVFYELVRLTADLGCAPAAIPASFRFGRASFES
jgi:DNA-directed RNA polymerase specialized sigma24 family protein